MWQTRSYAQPQNKLHQHHGWISRQNAQDHLALCFRLHSTQSPPPAAAAPSATSAHCLLPTWRHGLAATIPSRTVWRNATGQWLLPPADDHGHAGVSARPRNDDECRTVPSGCQKCADDADGPTANGGTHVDEPIIHHAPNQQPSHQPGLLLMSRGR
jgi:hypothetical protein